MRDKETAMNLANVIYGHYLAVDGQIDIPSYVTKFSQKITVGTSKSFAFSTNETEIYACMCVAFFVNDQTDFDYKRYVESYVKLYSKD